MPLAANLKSNDQAGGVLCVVELNLEYILNLLVSLEPCAVKVARTDLNGENIKDLPIMIEL
jgi:hypothetical protein